ncbi:MAG: ribosome small subunit-dependent GTPase A [Planctomycetota bacterium]
MSSNRRREKHIQKYFEEKEKGQEHQKLKKRAAQLRRAEQKSAGRSRRKVRRDDWEELIEGEASRLEQQETRASSTAAWVARLEANQKAPEASEADAGLARGRAVFVTAGGCRVAPEDGSKAVECDLAEHVRLRQRSALAIGDRVAFDAEARRVHTVLPRATWLSRPDPHRPSVERVLAANVDVVVIVAALRDPVLSVGLVERVLLAIERGGAEPLVCVTKLDLAQDVEAELEPLAPIALLGVDVLPCSTVTGDGVDAVRARLRGRTCVLVGHSGVGKSTLLNAFAPELDVATGRVRAADGKGRHNTTASSLYELDDGTCIVDTPGVRQFGLWRMTPDELRDAFPDLLEVASGCRFRDCSHDHEPGCAVRDAATRGGPLRARYASYLRILATLRA